MMIKGISQYIGLSGDGEFSGELAKTAASCGITHVFTSLNLPEADSQKALKDLKYLVGTAAENGLRVVCDVTRSTLSRLNLSPSNAPRELGLRALRLDDGFTAGDIAAILAAEDSLSIFLNASTIDGAFLAELKKKGADFSRLGAMHNYYPREGTALNTANFQRQTAALTAQGLMVGAFVAGGTEKRAPLYAGLPTLEEHRGRSVDFAARHLAALGATAVFIGDPNPTREELAALGRVREGEVQLTAELLTDDPAAINLLKHTFTARPDVAAYALRAADSRTILKETIKPGGEVRPRQVGDITLDNELYLRYMGELQIITTPQAADKRTNIVAKVTKEELCLIPLIQPKMKFSFKITAGD